MVADRSLPQLPSEKWEQNMMAGWATAWAVALISLEAVAICSTSLSCACMPWLVRVVMPAD